MKRHILLLTLVLGLLFLISFPTAFAQDDECRDAAGAPIPCTPVPRETPDEGDDNTGGDTGGQSGQPGDRDGDGLPDERDVCPDAGGHANLSGCPDTDGDNTPDIIDACPTVGGPDTNQGCPAEEGGEDPATTLPTEVAPDTSSLMPPLPSDGRCVVGTLRDGDVNVRATPDLNAAVVGSVTPGQTYPVAHVWISANGTWYRLISPAGWVAAEVVQLGGDCSQIPTSDFSDPATAQGAVPHWGPNGELTFCLPDYAAGEDTCVPTNTNGAVPNWGPNGELWFCLPQYDIGEDTCVVIPTNAMPHWNTLDDIVYCLPNDLGEEDCFVLDVDEADGGIVIADAGDPTGAPPENPNKHKFLLVGEDGLLVLTAPTPDDPTERPNADFPIYLAACLPDEECDVNVMMHGLDLPLAACYYDPTTNPEVEACDTDNLFAPGGEIQIESFSWGFVPFNPDLPIAACYYDPQTNPEVEACDTDNIMGEALDPDLPLAACFYDSQTNPEVEACDTDNLMGALPTEDLPIAACAFDPDAIIQCSTGDEAAGARITGLRSLSLDLVPPGTEGPMPQTREHILLARQVGVPSLLEEGFPGGLEITMGGDEDGIGLLLPAVQAAREAARRSS